MSFTKNTNFLNVVSINVDGNVHIFQNEIREAAQEVRVHFSNCRIRYRKTYPATTSDNHPKCHIMILSERKTASFEASQFFDWITGKRYECKHKLLIGYWIVCQLIRKCKLRNWWCSPWFQRIKNVNTYFRVAVPEILEDNNFINDNKTI